MRWGGSAACLGRGTKTKPAKRSRRSSTVAWSPRRLRRVVVVALAAAAVAAAAVIGLGGSIMIDLGGSRVRLAARSSIRICINSKF